VIEQVLQLDDSTANASIEPTAEPGHGHHDTPAAQHWIREGSP